MNQWQWLLDNVLTGLALMVLVAWGKTHTMVTKINSEITTLKALIKINTDAINAANNSNSQGMKSLDAELQVDLDRIRNDIEYLRQNSINGQELERHLVNINSVVNNAVATAQSIRRNNNE